jgi:serine/threonine protein kinase HipA of HipAB toxin-antitoxin module
MPALLRVCAGVVCWSTLEASASAADCSIAIAEAQRAEHSEQTKLKSNAVAKVKAKNAACSGNNISLGKS